MKINVTANESKFLHQVPAQPGVYRYYAADGELLYVGKAINLHKRVQSYFKKKSDLSPRISLMVSKIAYMEITVTENETSALILESNLIKSLKPKYNIIFRDDKSYPYIRISNHAYPLIEYFRGIKQPDDQIFGPYPNPYAVKETLDLLQRLFKLRTCSDTTLGNRKRPCMLYQVNLCSAPCVGNIAPAEYQQFVKYSQNFLRGEYGDLIAQLSKQMYQAAESCDFELAATLRDKIGVIKQLQSKQIISDSQVPLNADIVVHHTVNGYFYVYVIMVRNGLYVADKHFSHRELGSVAELFSSFLESYYRDNLAPTCVVIDFGFDSDYLSEFKEIYHCAIETKPSARVKQLQLMAHKNLQRVIENSQLANIYSNASQKLSELVGIPTIKRIECYDTSHNQGSNPVASMTVYANGKIDHGLYRKYNLNETINGDDLLALTTVLRRRLANQELALPQVILVDGGKGQLSVAKKLVEELGFHDKIKVIAIFKGEARKPELDQIIIDETTQLTFRQEPAIFRLLQGLRDEAHRFAITGHRKQQVKRMQKSQLNQIPGIGTQKRKALIAFFGSPHAVAEATIDELLQVEGIGIELANTVYNFFHE
jgi:excinuclease ABC subunit C